MYSITGIPTCPNLTNPENGNIHLTRGVTAGSKARYSCNAGFKVTGNRARRCQPNGQWTGKDPICEKSTFPKPYRHSS